MNEKPASLKKEMGLGQLTIIGLSGAVATAIFFSQLEMTAVAGPASLLSWILATAFYYFIVFTYVELSQDFPEAGGPY